MDETGWFADRTDDEGCEDALWQPFLQTGGCCFPLRVWFKTEAECETFIKTDIVGKGMLERSHLESKVTNG